MTARTLFETLALSQLSDSLGPRADDVQTDIDRVTALGFAPTLGSLLIRLKGGNDYKCHAEAVELIASRLFTIGSRPRNQWGHMDRMRRVASDAVRFYLLDMCNTCEGRGKLAHSYSGPQEEDAGMLCDTCGGTGKAARNVPGRARAIQQPGEIVARLETMLDEADGLIERAARLATGISRAKLARD